MAFADWLEVERARFDARLRDALRARTEMLEKRGDDRAALELWQSLLKRDSLDESTHRSAMRLFFKRGDVTAALRQFETCRRLLAQGLGLEPMPETLELAAEIENAASSLQRSLRLQLTPHLPPKLLRPPLLVGREREWAEMERAWQAARPILISGPAGAGKTRLMMDFVRSKGDDYLLTQGFPGDRAFPYSGITRTLQRLLAALPDVALEPWVRREYARLLPGRFAEPPPPPGEEDPVRLVSALSVLFREGAERFTALPVDDLQFCDEPSFAIGLHFSLTLGWQAGRAFVVAAYRRGEMPAAYEQQLQPVVERGLMTRLELGPLSAEGVGELLAGLGCEAGLGSYLYGLTGGNPQFIVEALKARFERGELELTVAEQLQLPANVGDTIRDRLGRLTPEALRVARLMAVAGRAVPLKAEELGRLLELPLTEVAAALEELEQAQIIEGGYFVHDLLHEAVLAALPVHRYRNLNERIAA